MGYSPSEYRPSQAQGAPLCDSGLLGTHPTLAFPALIPRPPAGWKVAAVTDGVGSQENAPHQGAGEQPEHLSRGGREAGGSRSTSEPSLQVPETRVIITWDFIYKTHSKVKLLKISSRQPQSIKPKHRAHF